MGRRRFSIFALALAPLLLLSACGSNAGGAGNGRSGVSDDPAWVATDASVTAPGTELTPVNLTTHSVERGATVGSLPSAMAFTKRDAALLVLSQGDDTLHELNPASGTVLHSVGVGVEPDAVAVAPGGHAGKGLAFVANLTSNSVTPVDLGTWKAGRSIPVGKQPVAIAVGPTIGGVTTVFVADFGSNTVTPINTTTLQAGAPIAVSAEPETMATAGGLVLVGSFSSHALTAINAGTQTIAAAVTLPVNPTGIAVTASGTTFYVSGGASVVPVTVASLVVGQPIALPGVAEAIALAPGDGVAWVALQTGSIVPVTLASAKVGHRIHVGGHPSAIAIAGG